MVVSENIWYLWVSFHWFRPCSWSGWRWACCHSHPARQLPTNLSPEQSEKSHCSVHLLFRYSLGYAVLCRVIYPACDAWVVWVVFDGDCESVFSHSLSIQWPVHLKHTWLEERTHQSFQCSILHYYFIVLFFPCAVFVPYPSVSYRLINVERSISVAGSDAVCEESVAVVVRVLRPYLSDGGVNRCSLAHAGVIR